MDDQSPRRVTESATADKLKGHAKEAYGTVKEKLGSATGDRRMEAEGQARNLDGKKDRLKGEIKEAIDDAKAKLKAAGEVVRDKVEEVRQHAREHTR